MSWKADKAWSDQFIPEIKSILGQALIGEPKLAEDELRNTDLISLIMPGSVRIACRIRKFEYLTKYADEFTIRSARPGPTPTELDKLLRGWGDYLFYGFANRDESSLAAWFVGDLQVFRAWADDYWCRFRELPGELRQNQDGSSMFRVFGVYDVPGEFVIARSDDRSLSQQEL